MDFPCQPWFLIGSSGDGSGDRDVVHEFPHVGSDGLHVLLEVYGVIGGGCLSEHTPVCGGKQSWSASDDPSGHTRIVFLLVW